MEVLSATNLRRLSGDSASAVADSWLIIKLVATILIYLGVGQVVFTSIEVWDYIDALYFRCQRTLEPFPIANQAVILRPYSHIPWSYSHGPWPYSHIPLPYSHIPWPYSHIPWPYSHGPRSDSHGMSVTWPMS